MLFYVNFASSLKDCEDCKEKHAELGNTEGPALDFVHHLFNYKSYAVFSTSFPSF